MFTATHNSALYTCKSSQISVVLECIVKLLAGCHYWISQYQIIISPRLQPKSIIQMKTTLKLHQKVACFLLHNTVFFNQNPRHDVYGSVFSQPSHMLNHTYICLLYTFYQTHAVVVCVCLSLLHTCCTTQLLLDHFICNVRTDSFHWWVHGAINGTFLSAV